MGRSPRSQTCSFADGTVPVALRLVESVTYPNGTLQLTYDIAGTPTYGTM